MGTIMNMGMYPMGTPQSNYLTQTKPGENPYEMVQNNYGGYAPTYDLPMPNPYYEASITKLLSLRTLAIMHPPMRRLHTRQIMMFN